MLDKRSRVTRELCGTGNTLMWRSIKPSVWSIFKSQLLNSRENSSILTFFGKKSMRQQEKTACQLHGADQPYAYAVCFSAQAHFSRALWNTRCKAQLTAVPWWLLLPGHQHEFVWGQEMWDRTSPRKEESPNPGGSFACDHLVPFLAAASCRTCL